MEIIVWRYYLRVCWLVLISSGIGWTQSTEPMPDSIVRYRRTPLDTSSINGLNRYAWNLAVASRFAQADSILKQTEQAARQLNYPYGLEQAYYSWGLLNYFQDKYERALFFGNKARRIVEQNRIPVKAQQELYAHIGHTHYCLHQYENSLSIFLKAIQLTEQHGLTQRVTPTFVGVGNVLRVMGRHNEALVYFRRALVVSRQESNKRFAALALTHMGAFLSSLGKQNSAEALTYFQQALPIARQVNSRKIWADDLTLIGQMHLNLGHPKKALAYLSQAEKICNKDGFLDQRGANCYVLGLTYQALKQLARAESYLLQSLQLAQQINDADGIRTRTQALADHYVQIGQYKRAYHYHQAMTAVKDSLFSIESARHAHELVTRYETETKEQQLKLLAEKHRRASLQRNALLAVGTLFLLLVVCLAAWLLNRARLSRLEEAQQLRQQLAHDLHDEMGSTLSSISLLSSMSNDLLHQAGPAGETPELVQRMVAKIGTDTRQMQQTIDELIWMVKPGTDSLGQIAARIRAYAEPLLEGKGIPFQFVFELSLERQPVSLAIRRNLYLLGKEAITNILKHAQATQVTLRFGYGHDNRYGGTVTVLIEDNGRGFDPADPTARTGLRSMQQRATAMGGSLAIRSAPGQGTSLRLTVAV